MGRAARGRPARGPARRPDPGRGRRPAADHAVGDGHRVPPVPRGGRMSTRDDLVLVIDTATTRAVVALGNADGTMLAERSWIAGYRHGEELLPRIEGLLADEATGLHAIVGIVVGTGPGAFTGLRVGIATAKALAHARGIPIVGVATA